MCDGIVEKVRLISNHVPKHSKPVNDKEFGHYLAGLIQGPVIVLYCIVIIL